MSYTGKILSLSVDIEEPSINMSKLTIAVTDGDRRRSVYWWWWGTSQFFRRRQCAAAMRLAIERKKAQKAGWLMNCIFDVNQIILRNHTRQTGPVKTYYIGMDIAF